MRPSAVVVMLGVLSACGDPTHVDAPDAVPDTAPPERRRVRGPSPPRVTPSEPVVNDAAGDARAQRLLQDLGGAETRESAEERLEALPEGERIDLLRRGLMGNAPDAALEAARRLEHHWLDADESERFVDVLLPHLFDEDDAIDFEELRSALGSAEIADVLQEMREHEAVAGERTLLGALHRQLRAEHLPALVEMALSRDRALAEQAFEEIGIVVMYTNRHRTDVARLFAGRADVPQETGRIPDDLIVSLRAILGDASLGEVRRSMFLAWALRWLRDCHPRGPEDAAFLRELISTSRTAPGLGSWERENVQICALIGLADRPTGWLERDLEENAAAWGGDAGLVARALTGSDAELRSMAGASPLVMALLVELEHREVEYALFEALHGRKAHAALDFTDDVYSARFRFRLPWERAGRRRLDPRPRGGPRRDLDPALMLRLATLYPELDGRRYVAPFLAGLAEPGGLARSASGPAELHGDVLPSLEGDALRDVLRHALTAGTADDRAEAARLLALLRDEPSEQALIDLAVAGRAEEGVMADVAEWASSGGRKRIRAWLAADGTELEMQTLAALGRLPRALARRFGEEAAERLRDGAEHAEEVVALLRAGDAIGALLLHLDVNVHAELDGIGRIERMGRDDEKRVREHLRTWAARRGDGRVHWALGELALLGEASSRNDIEDVVESGRYRWIDDASADVLLLGGDGELGFWGREAESNCCRAVAVKRVFEDGLRVNVSEEMGFQSGQLVTLAEWLRWRVGRDDWLLTDPLGRDDWRIGRPDRLRALLWSDLADGYVPSLR